jgi:hypothetical protein
MVKELANANPWRSWSPFACVPGGLHPTLTAVLCGTYLIGLDNRRAKSRSGHKGTEEDFQWREEQSGKVISISGIWMCP